MVNVHALTRSMAANIATLVTDLMQGVHHWLELWHHISPVPWAQYTIVTESPCL